MEFLRYSEDKEALRKVIASHPERYYTMDKRILESGVENDGLSHCNVEF